MHHRDDRNDEGVLGGIVTIVIVGVLLGVAFNWLGLGASPAWGLSWIAEDKLGQLEAQEAVTAADPVPAPANGITASDDPMAVPGGAAQAGLPQIPDLDRPIEIKLDAVRQLVDADAVVVVDAREAYEFVEGRIAGAVNLPYDEVTSEPERLEQLETGGRPIVVYCGGGACELSLSLAWDLIYAGHKRVTVYMGGYPEWEAAGGAIERGAGEAGLMAVPRMLSHPAFVRLCQIAIGVLLGIAGLAKLGDLQSFADQIHNFRIVPVAAEHLIALSLPWIEIVAALALILGIRARGAAVLVTLLVGAFTLAVVAAMFRGLDIECGCFGTADASRVGVMKVLQNLGMLLLGWVGTARRQ